MSHFTRHIPRIEVERGDAVQSYATHELGVVQTRQRRKYAQRHQTPSPSFSTENDIHNTVE